MDILDRVFRLTLSAAVHRELRNLKQAGVSGEKFVQALAGLYDRHHLSDLLDRARSETAPTEPVVRIVCGEEFVP